MGILADIVLQNGGMVTDVMPKAQPHEEIHSGLTHLHIVESMQQRKK
jgi:predicted Rossmann-fold nucleotide-binding protein